MSVTGEIRKLKRILVDKIPRFVSYKRYEEAVYKQMLAEEFIGEMLSFLRNIKVVNSHTIVGEFTTETYHTIELAVASNFDVKIPLYQYETDTIKSSVIRNDVFATLLEAALRKETNIEVKITDVPFYSDFWAGKRIIQFSLQETWKSNKSIYELLSIIDDVTSRMLSEIADTVALRLIQENDTLNAILLSVGLNQD